MIEIKAEKSNIRMKLRGEGTECAAEAVMIVNRLYHNLKESEPELGELFRTALLETDLPWKTARPDEGVSVEIRFPDAGRKTGAKRTRPAKSKQGVIHWGFHGKVPMTIDESARLRESLGDDEFIRCTHFMDDFIYRNGDTRQWEKDFAAATLRCSQEKWYNSGGGME